MCFLHVTPNLTCDVMDFSKLVPTCVVNYALIYSLTHSLMCPNGAQNTSHTPAQPLTAFKRFYSGGPFALHHREASTSHKAQRFYA